MTRLLRRMLPALALLGTSALVGLAGAPNALAGPAPTGTGVTPRVSGIYYQIVARHSGKCADVQGASTVDVTPVIQYHCINNHVNQEWDLTRNSDGYYQIRVWHSGKCLDVEAASTANSARIIQYRCHGGANQQWKLTRNAEGYYQVLARNSGKCLDVQGSSSADGAQFIQYTCHGGNNQQFTFVGDFG